MFFWFHICLILLYSLLLMSFGGHDVSMFDIFVCVFVLVILICFMVSLLSLHLLVFLICLTYPILVNVCVFTFSLLLVCICVVFKVCFQVFKVIIFFYVFTNFHMFYGNLYLCIILFCVLVRFIFPCLMIFIFCLFCLCYDRHIVPILLLPMISFLPLLFQFPLFVFKLILVFLEELFL